MDLSFLPLPGEGGLARLTGLTMLTTINHGGIAFRGSQAYPIDQQMQKTLSYGQFIGMEL
jgi:hypothetical protein